MHILFDGNINNPEIEISNSCKELINFGNQLINIDKDIKIKSKDKKSKFYPENIKYLYVKVTNYKDKKNLIKFVLMGEKLICEGTKYAFLKLGQQYLIILMKLALLGIIYIWTILKETIWLLKPIVT